MLIEALATLNCVAAIAVAVFTFRYSAARERRWDHPWPPVENREAYAREDKYRRGLDLRRMVGLMASMFICCPLAIYLSGTLRPEWVSEGWRIATALVSLAAMVAVLIRTDIHNGREYDAWARRYRRW